MSWTLVPSALKSVSSVQSVVPISGLRITALCGSGGGLGRVAQASGLRRSPLASRRLALPYRCASSTRPGQSSVSRGSLKRKRSGADFFQQAPRRLLRKPHAKDAKDAKKNSSRSRCVLGDLCVRPFMVFQQPASSLLKYWCHLTLCLAPAPALPTPPLQTEQEQEQEKEGRTARRGFSTGC